MCGICGVLSFHSPLDKEVIQRMCQTMAHRGPDGAGILLENASEKQPISIALGHRRLSIIDLSEAGRQPMSNEDDTVWITYNGEIYNYKEIKAELKVKGHRFKSDTDSEVVIHAYEEYGIDSLRKLRGMFAFAIWDTINRRLFIARDRLGIKPLYYFWDGRAFLFASEIKAILATGLVDRVIDPQGLIGYLNFGCVPCPFTLIRGVKALRPGHYGIFDENGFQTRRYWDIPSVGEQEKIRVKSEKEILDRVRYLLEEAVKIRLISDVPLGAFLSGGIDSSAVVGLMSRFSDSPARTFSITFNEKEYNEGSFAKLAAERFSTIHTEFLVTAHDVLDEMPNIIQAMDQPTVDGVNTYFVSKVAKEGGITVALSGLGGDELFGGYPSFQILPKMNRAMNWWCHLPKRLQHLLFLLLERRAFKDTKAKKLSYLLSNGTYTLTDLFAVSRIFYFREEAKEFIDPNIIASVDFQFLEYAHCFPGETNELSPFDAISYLELKTYLHNMLLRDTDNMSMAHSLEVRVPLVDSKLIEFMMGVPSQMKQSHKISKRLLVESLNELLPPDIAYRKKATFTFPFENWLRAELRNFVIDTISAGPNGILDSKRILELYQDFEAGDPLINFPRIWMLVVLKAWLEENHIGA